MTKKERAEWLLKYLNKRWPKPAVPLNHSDPYTLLVAVVLSAQCTDKRVNEVTPELFRLAPNPRKMIGLGVDKIQQIIRPCGLSPQKAKALYGLSKILLDQYQGQVPKSLKELEKLPGVGHKTASVVMIQAFGQPAFPVDTHIHRLAQMWGLTSGKSVAQTEQDLKKIFPESSWADLHLQIIYYGREECSARGCNGIRCPVCKHLYPTRKTPIRAKKP